MYVEFMKKKSKKKVDFTKISGFMIFHYSDAKITKAKINFSEKRLRDEEKILNITLRRGICTPENTPGNTSQN